MYYSYKLNKSDKINFKITIQICQSRTQIVNKPRFPYAMQGY